MEQPAMVNEEYGPSDREEQVLDEFKRGRDVDPPRPWGRANPKHFRAHTPLDKGQVEYALSNLRTAGWIRRLNDAGLYEFVEDPRENDERD
jgi:hypothetical protein